MIAQLENNVVKVMDKASGTLRGYGELVLLPNTRRWLVDGGVLKSRGVFAGGITCLVDPLCDQIVLAGSER